jgi:hypothetical protein
MAKDSTDRKLAPIYGRAVELRDAGASDETIARALGVVVEAVPTLIEVALRKQAHQADGDTPREDEQA